MTGWFAPTETGVIAIAYILLVVIPFLNPAYLKNALLMASKSSTCGSHRRCAPASAICVIFARIAFTSFLPDVVLWLPKHAFPESVGCFKSPAGTGYIRP